ncbi:Bor family protein [Leptothrix ochracea]|uniref:Bor family protein n=1 Tax=Leptothrix ochracea TaxID=735331 RepID=UPI0034E2D434
MMKKVILAAMVASLAGCATQSYQLQSGGPSLPTREVSQNFFLSGIGQTQEINATEVCGSASKITKVETLISPVDGILGGVTLGIYTPKTARVYCAR